ncbi:phospholipase A2-like [Chelonus insularis]|uniref:phospholipase A2-like n=1 Tax=Chelonus insularis TaxID=460826 RepID=UPI001588D95A|nr:phospholipase A2-like [Chelonus insularis]
MNYFRQILKLNELFVLILVIQVANYGVQSAPAPNDKVQTKMTIVERLLEEFQSMLPGNQTGGTFGEILNMFEGRFHAIFPGTRWCGSGNDASDYDDLGMFYKSDQCCRSHDSCALSIEAGKTLGRLINNGIFTRSACSCDEEFYKCLKNIGSVIARSIGDTYFNILQPQCFAEEYPIESCERYSGFFKRGKCLQYKLDTSKNKTLEWFDNPTF